ncbi:MAG: DNA replication and repair protein RecF [Treponema sp.]|nr:DNA replication and repair protein RecF [Treponema sp.]MCL2237936.1 DNA replication and repair protein RecF [Treponema sp.]
MFFSSLRTTSFRNLCDAEISTGAKDVFLVGENGQGKSNFLEALYFCAYASSFRTSRDAEIARNEANAKDFGAEVKLSDSVNDKILVKCENAKKHIFINDKRAEDRKELLSIAPSIVFCHEDMEFVNGSPERRRWFFDQTLSLYDPVYLEDLRRYRRVLKSRNTILRDSALGKLKEDPAPVLDALDPQFAMYGIKLMEKREKAAEEFSALFGSLYEEVSGIKGIRVRYIQSWKNPEPCELLSNYITERLKQRRSSELAAGLSLSGPHRDRYQFAHNGAGAAVDFTIKASTGQKRLLALLLRAAQARRYSKETGLKPILLLDDVLLEMDGEKRRRFLSVLPAYDQAFYTFLPEEPYQHYQKGDTLVYKVKDGELGK